MKRPTDAEHREAAERQAAEILGAVDFSAPRGVSEVLATYTLQLIGPDHGREFTGISPLIIWEAEENMSDLLPPGYSVVIREWDEEKK